MHYIKQKRPKVDKCNICEKVSDLTWDHIPPKSCFNNVRTICDELFGHVKQEINKSPKEYLIFQSGIKYRTICSDCNNRLLGARYDAELKELVDYVDVIFGSRLLLPQAQTLSLNANKITRSIVGHLLSAKRDFDGETLIDKKLRTFFLNEHALPPKDLQLLYYLYPYTSLLILRDIVVHDIRELPGGLISCLLFYPIAFILCEKGKTCGLNDMFSLCTDNIDDNANISIDFLSCKHSDGKVRSYLWPCNISVHKDGTPFIMGGKHFTDSIFARNRTIKG